MTVSGAPLLARGGSDNRMHRAIHAAVAALLIAGICCLALEGPHLVALRPALVGATSLSSTQWLPPWERDYIRWWKAHQLLLEAPGRMLMVGAILSGRLTIVKASQPTGLCHRAFQLVAGCGCLLFLGGPLVRRPLLSVMGSVIVSVSVALATITAHIVGISVMAGEELQSELRDILKNIACLGGFLAVLGYDLQRLPMPGTRLRPLQSQAWVLLIIGHILVALVFLVPGMALRIKGFIGIAKWRGYPAPAFMGLMAFLFTVGGASCMMVGAAAHLPMTSCAGDKFCAIFLCIATYSGHWLQLSSSTGDEHAQHMRAVAKNLSIVGALVTMLSIDMLDL